MKTISVNEITNNVSVQFENTTGTNTALNKFTLNTHVHGISTTQQRVSRVTLEKYHFYMISSSLVSHELLLAFWTCG